MYEVFYKIDCFSAYNVEQTEKMKNLKVQYPGGGSYIQE